MASFLSLLTVLLPLLFWVGYHLYTDRHIPEPAGNLALAFVLGMGSYFLGMLMYEGLGLINLRFDAQLLAETHWPSGLAYSVFAIGVIEESVKLIPFVLVVLKFKAFNEPIDGIVYASFIALGFTMLENFSYLRWLTDAEALARGFVGPVVHVVFASIWGYYVGRAYLCSQKLPLVVVSALAASAFLHGVYDFVVLALPPFMLVVSATLVAAIWVWRLHLIRDLHNLPEGPCPTEVNHIDTDQNTN